MDAQLIRYLDGELSEAEAAGFLERIDNEPELRKALEAEERLLEAARAMPEPAPSAGFTDRVMDAILETRAFTKPHAARTARPRWIFAISAAAMILLAFALGRNSVSPSNPGQDELASAGTDQAAATTLAGHPVLRPDFASLDTGAGQGLRIVQLVYIPEGNAPTQVAVAGSFSGWQTGKIPMQKQEGVWTATLILPPGSYEYMFLEDDTRWVTDPRAPLTRDDGFGGRNAVLDVDA